MEIKKNKFDKTIYIGDIHWNKRFLSLVKEYDDWKTKFILVWDFFDKWKNSAEVFYKIKELKETGKLDWVLWNHDLFFIFSFLPTKYIPSYVKEKYRTQFSIKSNGGGETFHSFFNYFKKNNLDSKKEFENIAKWLFSNFNIYLEYQNNFIVHWGISISSKGAILWDLIDWTFYQGIELIKMYNKKLKEFDTKILNKFTALYSPIKTCNENIKRGITTIEDLAWTEYFELFLPTWYHNSSYFKNESKYKSLIKYLKEKKINRLICGHDYMGWDTIMIFDEHQNERIVNLDRAGEAIWNWDEIEKDRAIWYCIIDNSWYKVETKDFWSYWTKISETEREYFRGINRTRTKFQLPFPL